MGEEVISRLVIDCNINSTGAVSGGKKAEESLRNIKHTAEKTSGSLGKIANSFKRIILYRAIRSVLSGITSSFKEGVKNLYQFSSLAGTSFASSMDRLSTSLMNVKNSLAVSIAPIIEGYIVPAVEKLTNWIMTACNAIARFNAILAGQKTYAAATTGAVSKYASAVKNATKSLLGFDEINRLSSSGSSAGSTDYSNMFETRDVGNLSEFEQKVQSLAENIKNGIAAIEALVSIAFLAVGAILTFSGANIPLGLSLLAIGAVGMAHSLKQDWSAIPDSVKEAVAEIFAVLGIAFLAIGAVLAFSGANIPLGIGLMAAGVLTMGGVSLMWDKLGKNVQDQVAWLMALLGISLLAIGAVIAFACPTKLALGVGLMAAGAASLATAVNLNWSGIKEKLSSVFEENRNMITAGGVGLFISGLLIAMSGAGLPLGLGMMAAGGFVIAKAITPSWGTDLLNGLKEGLDKIKNWWNTTVKPYIDSCKNAFASIFDTSSSTFSNTRVSGTFGSVSSKVGGFAGPRASGGFVGDGQLFLAREAGPELVGTIGGTTAVMNNDQIVSAVSTGVYNAVVSAMGNRGGENCVKVYLDSKEIRAGQRRLNKALG